MHASDKNDPPRMRRRLFTRRNALLLGIAGGAGCLIDAFGIEPGILTVTRREVISPTLPITLDGFKICLLADFHFRPGKDDALLEKVIAAVAIEQPDLITLPGDFMNHDPAVIAPLLEFLGRLTSRHGVFASMGNHDGWGGDRAVIKRQFEQNGISFLINRHSVLTVRGERLAVAGTDNVWDGNPDPASMLAGLRPEIPVVALVHEPDYFDQLTTHRDILLQVSGHTHGGQCRVPFLDYAPVKVRYGRKYVSGAFARGNSQLFVTRGVGVTGLEARFACPPELAVLRLRSST